MESIGPERTVEPQRIEVLGRHPQRREQPDRQIFDPAGDERQRAERGIVEPANVVDRDQHR